MFKFATLYIMHRKQQMTTRTFFGSKQNSVWILMVVGKSVQSVHDFAVSIWLRTEIDGAKKVCNMQWV